MTTASSAWYIRGEGNKPLGPFATEELIESWHTKRIDPNTLCWQDGMAEWLPLVTVEPFASTIRAERRSARMKIFRLVAVGLLTTVVLVIIAGVGYFWWTESDTLARATRLITAEHYDEASTLLEPMATRCYFFRRRASYLLALGLVRQFASAPKAGDACDDLLADAKKQFGELFAASPKWHEDAKADLTGILGAVPIAVSGPLKRSVQLASFLSTMELADRKQLTSELFSKAKSIWADPQRGPEQVDGEAVAWMMNEDSTLVNDTLATIIPDSTNIEASLDRRLACIQQWVRGRPALAALFETGITDRADKLASAGHLKQAHRLTIAVKGIDSRFNTWGFWEKHFHKIDGKNWKMHLKSWRSWLKGRTTPSDWKELRISTATLQNGSPMQS